MRRHGEIVFFAGCFDFALQAMKHDFDDAFRFSRDPFTFCERGELSTANAFSVRSMTGSTVEFVRGFSWMISQKRRDEGQCSDEKMFHVFRIRYGGQIGV